MSKRPPLGTTGKLALAGKRNRARQLLDREQRERNCRDLLSLVGKNSSLAVSSCSGQGRHPATKGMLLALQALRRLVEAVKPTTSHKPHMRVNTHHMGTNTSLIDPR